MVEEVILPESVPVFPLPDHVLLPATPAPYRIFEPRYRAMMRYVLGLPETERWIAVPRLVPGHEAEYEGRPPFFDIAVVARLLEVIENRDGTFHVVLGEGVRCRAREIASPWPFRLAAPSPIADRPSAVASATFDALVDVVTALNRVLGAGGRSLAAVMHAPAPPADKVYRLASVLIQNPDRRQALLECRDPESREDQVLSAAAVLLSLAHGKKSDEAPS